MSESRIQAEIRLAASAAGLTLWRNNVGTGWAGEVSRLPDGSVLIRNPRPIQAGLCKGSSDLIGLRPILITANHVGTTLAQFVGLEVKAARGRVTAQQQTFLDFVVRCGGLAAVVRAADELKGLTGAANTREAITQRSESEIIE